MPRVSNHEASGEATMISSEPETALERDESRAALIQR